MNQIDRYIAKHILICVIIVTFIIVGIEVILTTFEVFDFGNKTANFWKPFQLVVMQTIPYRIFDYFPTLVFLGTLLGMGQLATHNEFVAMQVAGVSTNRILLAALKAAFILIVFIFIWGEVIAPKAERTALRMQAAQDKLAQTFSTTTGIWLRDKDSFIHIQNFSEGELFEIREFVIDKNFQLETTSHIENARYQDNHWKLKNVVSTHFTKDGTARRTQESEATRAHWINPSILEILTREPNTMTIRELWRYTEYLTANHLDGKLFLQRLWQKMGSPFAIVIMVYLAIPLLLGPLKQRNLGIRLFIGALLGFAYLVMYQTLATTTLVYRVPPYLCVLLPNLLFLGIGFALIKRYRL